MKFTSFFRKKKTQVRAFAAALLSRLTSDWISSFTSQDAELRGSIKTLRNRARDLGRNDDHARSYLRSAENNVVGLGIKLQSNIRDENNNPLIKLNSQIEKEWKKWCRKDSCHAAGTLDFVDIERLLIRNRLESGEIYVRFIYKKLGRSKIPLTLQILEADHLDVDYNGMYENNVVKMGVEQDEFGRPVAYHMFADHPGDLSFPRKNAEIKRVRVLAEDIIPLFRQERPIQNRGFTNFSSAMLSMRHLSGYVEGTIVRKRAESSIMGFIETPEGELQGSEVSNNERLEDFSPGKFSYLAPGEKVTVPQISSGPSEFDPFTQAIIRKMAAGLGSSYEEIAKDFSRSNYSSSRLSLMSERDNWQIEQDWFSRNFHQRVFEKFLEKLIYLGHVEIKLGDYLKDPEKFNMPKWMPRGWDWVDPLKDITADKEALRACTTTYTDILAAKGKDFDETVNQIKKERETFQRLGICPDTLLEQKEKSNNQQNGDFNDSQDEDK